MRKSWTEDRLTIGQVSRMHGISPKMLRYWDEINLLKPHIVDEHTSYRYYSSAQFFLLNFIKYLKEVGATYSEIKKYLGGTEMGKLESFLKMQLEATREKMKRLNEIESSFSQYLSAIEEARSVTNLDTPFIASFPERSIIFYDMEVTTRILFEQAIRKLERVIRGNPILLLTSVGLFMEQDQLMTGKLAALDGVFIMAEEYKAKKNNIRVLPAGEYALIRFWGTLASSTTYYKKLKEFIDRKSYRMEGYVYQRCVAPGLDSHKKGHLSEVFVQIREK